MGQTVAATEEKQPRRIRRLLPAGRVALDICLCIALLCVQMDYTCIYITLDTKPCDTSCKMSECYNHPTTKNQHTLYTFSSICCRKAAKGSGRC